MAALDQIHRLAQLRVQRVTGGVIRGLLWSVDLDDRGDTVRDAYRAATATVVAAGQRQAAEFALAYMRAHSPPTEPADVAGALADRLMDADDPGAIVGLLRLWSLVDEGMDADEARLAAGEYAGDLAAVDLQLAARDGLDEGARVAEREPDSWRLEPEPSACKWCQFIADTGPRYLSAESVPVPHSPGGDHPGGVCQCSPAPYYREEEE